MNEKAILQILEHNPEDFTLTMLYSGLISKGDGAGALHLLGQLTDREICALAATCGYLAITHSLPDTNILKAIALVCVRRLPFFYFMPRSIDELNELKILLNIRVPCEIRHILRDITSIIMCNSRL